MREKARIKPFLVAVVLAWIAASSSAEAATRRFTALVTSVQTSAPTPSPRCAAPRVLVTFAGSAIGTLFGRASVHHSHCIIDDPADPTIINGEMVIDGARGDLVLRYSGMDTGGEPGGDLHDRGRDRRIRTRLRRRDLQRFRRAGGRARVRRPARPADSAVALR